MTGDREARDVESRLRASLNAYAEVVDVDEVLSGERVAASRRSPAPRRWRSALVAAAAVLAVAGGTWAIVDRGDGAAPTAASAGESAVLDGEARTGSARPSTVDPSAEAAAGAAAAGEAPRLPESPEVGVPYSFDLYTHCGVLGADVGGIWFAARPPLLDGPGSPPPGWDDPHQRGTLTLEAPDTAVFRDEAGHEVRLSAAESERPSPCS